MIKIKICGITNVEDAIYCSKYSDLIGVIVDVPVDTPRKIDRKKAKEIFSKTLFVEKVVVLMPKSVEEVVEIDRYLKPDYIQLHGNETIEMVKEIKDSINARLIKAITVKDYDAIDVAKSYARYVDAILLDSKKESYVRGVTHNWQISKTIAKKVDVPVFLAGGLNVENVVNAVKHVNPYGIDISSGVEEYPGKKDHLKVKLLYARIQEFIVKMIKEKTF